jgi:hypothetical protein
MQMRGRGKIENPKPVSPIFLLINEPPGSFLPPGHENEHDRTQIGKVVSN